MSNKRVRYPLSASVIQGPSVPPSDVGQVQRVLTGVFEQFSNFFDGPPGADASLLQRRSGKGRSRVNTGEKKRGLQLRTALTLFLLGFSPVNGWPGAHNGKNPIKSNVSNKNNVDLAFDSVDFGFLLPMHGSASAGASTNTYTPSNAGAGGIKGGVAPLPRGWTPFFDEEVNRQRGLKTGVPYAYHN